MEYPVGIAVHTAWYSDIVPDVGICEWLPPIFISRRDVERKRVLLVAKSASLDAFDLVRASCLVPFHRDLAQFFSRCVIAKTAAGHYKVVWTSPLRNGVLVVRIKIKVDQRLHLLIKISCAGSRMIEYGELIIT